MSGEKGRLNSTVFASAKGRQSRQPAGCSPGSGPVSAAGGHASLTAPAPMMTDDEVLAAVDCAHTAHTHVSPTAIRNAGSSIILTDPMLIAAARSCAANVGARQQTARRARAFHFRMPDESATAGCRPLAFRALPHRRVVYSYNP